MVTKHIGKIVHRRWRIMLKINICTGKQVCKQTSLLVKRLKGKQTNNQASVQFIFFSQVSNNTTNQSEMINVELDNAGRVKSGKVRKQCELCGEWSNIKWFFKHMSEVHNALFCRCCREYLPIHEHKEHRQWHQMPPYMGQKIRIEEGQPIIIDRKERASLTPIGSLAAWGGSSGGLGIGLKISKLPKTSMTLLQL